jgi:hypothetical protein
MNQHVKQSCAGHNEVHFDHTKNIYPLLRGTCPPTVIWDYNFVPGGYVVGAYKINLFAGQVPGFFACGAHMVIMPNWVVREPAHSNQDKHITSNGRQSSDLLYGLLQQHPITFVQGLAKIAPNVDVTLTTLSALEAETHHPLVAATIAANEKLTNSTDKNAASASWQINRRYIGDAKAFFVFYDTNKISCPRKYLLALTNCN